MLLSEAFAALHYIKYDSFLRGIATNEGTVLEWSTTRQRDRGLNGSQNVYQSDTRDCFCSFASWLRFDRGELNKQLIGCALPL